MNQLYCVVYAFIYDYPKRREIKSPISTYTLYDVYTFGRIWKGSWQARWAAHVRGRLTPGTQCVSHTIVCTYSYSRTKDVYRSRSAARTPYECAGETRQTARVCLRDIRFHIRAHYCYTVHVLLQSIPLPALIVYTRCLRVAAVIWRVFTFAIAPTLKPQLYCFLFRSNGRDHSSSLLFYNITYCMHIQRVRVCPSGR